MHFFAKFIRLTLRVFFFLRKKLIKKICNNMILNKMLFVFLSFKKEKYSKKRI